MNEQKKGGTLVWVVSVVVLALIAYGAYKYVGNQSSNATPIVNNPNPTPPTNTVPPTNTKPPVTTPPKTTTSQFKDGQYSVVGHYNSPGGFESLDVSVTLKNDIITASTVSDGGGSFTGSRYKARFISGYQTYVIGQKITNVELSRVSGSSLTPIGWNDAISQIESEARA